MTKKITVPQLGESVVEATVGQWHKQEGDTVAVGDILVELETDKVDVEVGADSAGILVRILQQTGTDVQIGELLGEIEEGGAEEDGSSEVEEKPEVKVPDEDERVTPVARRLAEEQEVDSSEVEKKPEVKVSDEDERVTPVARRLAEEQEVDLAQVKGSGANGRITRQDVEAYLQQQTKPAEKAAVSPSQPPPQPTPATKPAAVPKADDPREERIRLSRRRRTIAQRLVEAQHSAAMLTTFNDVDMSAVIDIRKRWQEEFQKRHNIKLGFMSFFVKAAVAALKAFPRLNAEMDGDEMILKHYYDIGMAVGAEEGLVVPVIRAADRQSFAQIEQDIRDFVQKAQDGSLSLEDLRGGTFTITNGGVFGSMLSTPILNPPQVGILGLHRIEERPIARNGQVIIRPMMYLALSYDHRIVDGSEAVRFLVHIKELIEDPEALLLEG